MTEIWRDIEGYEGLYQVSNTGFVKSMRGNRILKPSVTVMHQMVNLYKDRKPFSTYVHHLVAAAFLGERPDNHVIHHIDENPLNNRADNLQYVTQYQNIHLSTKMTKLTEDEVKAMIYAYNTSSLTLQSIGRAFGVRKQRVFSIVNGHSWTHLHHLVSPRNRNQEQAS